MHTQTGEIKDWEDIEKMPPQMRADWVPITRDVSAREQLNKRVRLYAPCGCGSGKKFKFCCHRQPNKA